MARFASLGLIRVKDKLPHLGYIPNYVAVIQEYSRRSLTYYEDTLPAIEGVLRTFDSSKWAYFAGLPRENFDIALLWQPSVGHICTRLGTSDVTAPTWSWARWHFGGGCKWYTEDMTDTKFKSSIPGRYLIFRRYTASTMWALEGNKRVAVIKGKDYDDNRPPATKYLPRMTQRHLRRAGNLLFFYATRVRFQIGKPILRAGSGQDHTGDIIWIYQLLDRNRSCVGEIWISRREASRSHKRRNFLTISKGRRLIYSQEMIAKEYIPTTTDGKGNTRNHPPSEWETVNVMLVEQDHNVAFRIALGKVIKKAWENATRDKHWIFLA